MPRLYNVHQYATILGSMATTHRISNTSSNYVRVPREEYVYLSALKRDFQKLVNYMREIQDTEEARQDIKAGRVKSQEQVFKELGF